METKFSNCNFLLKNPSICHLKFHILNNVKKPIHKLEVIMNKKLLLSALIALPMAASQIHAVSEVSLETEMKHSQDTLSTACQDVETMSTKLTIMEQLNTELIKLEVVAKDAMERTAELNENHAARMAAKELQRHVKKFMEESQKSHKEAIDLLNKAKGRVNEIAEKIKKNTQQA